METMDTRRWRVRTDHDSDRFGHVTPLRVEEDEESDEVEAGEEIPDFEGGGLRGVRAVRAVHLDAGAEVMPNRAGRSFLGVGGAHGFPPFGNGAIGFEDHGEDFAGTHEVGKFTEERAFAVNGVEAAGFLLGEAH